MSLLLALLKADSPVARAHLRALVRTLKAQRKKAKPKKAKRVKS